MATKSSIEWTESTWNPLTGCTKISPGCKLCYAERMSYRLKAMGQRNYRNGFRLTLHKHMLDTPLHWKKPQVVFVNSMSDLFQTYRSRQRTAVGHPLKTRKSHSTYRSRSSNTCSPQCARRIGTDFRFSRSADAGYWN